MAKRAKKTSKKQMAFASHLTQIDAYIEHIKETITLLPAQSELAPNVNSNEANAAFLATLLNVLHLFNEHRVLLKEMQYAAEENSFSSTSYSLSEYFLLKENSGHHC